MGWESGRVASPSKGLENKLGSREKPRHFCLGCLGRRGAGILLTLGANSSYCMTACGSQINPTPIPVLGRAAPGCPVLPRPGRVGPGPGCGGAQAEAHRQQGSQGVVCTHTQASGNGPGLRIMQRESYH